MRRHLRREQSPCRRAARCAEIVKAEAGTLTRMHWSTSLEVGKRESASPVPAVVGPQQREKRSVLGDGQKLSVAIGPACRGEGEAKYPDFSYKLIRHVRSSWRLVLRGEYPRKRYTEI